MRIMTTAAGVSAALAGVLACAAQGVFFATALWLAHRWVAGRWRGAAVPAEAYAGRVVWITGASSGIGRALALRLAEVGADLVLTARSEDRLAQVADEVRSAFPRGSGARVKVVPADLGGDPHKLEALAKRLSDPDDATGLGCVDVLVNNAGVGSRSPVTDTSLATDVHVLHVNFLSAVALTKGVLPAMRKRGSGRVVVVSSVQGKFGLPFRSSYAASKHALHGWFDSLRAEVAEEGVTVTLVCPGYVATNFSVGAVRGDGTAHGKMDATTASGMSPDGLAGLVLAAAADGAAEVTAADLKVHVAIALRALFPEALAGLLARRARKGEGAG